jgi:hypothetical protein
MSSIPCPKKSNTAFVSKIRHLLEIMGFLTDGIIFAALIDPGFPQLAAVSIVVSWGRQILG